MAVKGPREDRGPDDQRATVALCVGGSNQWREEYDQAKALVERCGMVPMNFVCNDTIVEFPDHLHHAVTLHPEKMVKWLHERLKRQLPPVDCTWCHRPYANFTNHTKEIGTSSGGHCAKIARELGFTHIIFCGVPMTVEGQHFVRKQPWNAAHGFRRGIGRLYHDSRVYIRSMSGWTREQFGPPDSEWLQTELPDVKPQFPQHFGLRA